MAHREDPQNRLMALLPAADRDRLTPHLKRVGLEYKRPLYTAGKDIRSVYFLEHGVASLVIHLQNGSQSEVGTIGNEGIVGFPVLMGDKTAPTSVYIQVPGEGLQMGAAAFRRELDRSQTMREVMGRYAHAFFNQVAQSAACAHFHHIHERCCRWLLMTHDRMGSDEFLLTQEFLSMMLGVRRAGVTEAAGAIREAGLIKYRHGHVSILDRPGLEARACECYAVSKAEFDRLLGISPSAA